MGGENLLEKAEEQEKLLEQSAKEMEERLEKYEELRKAIAEKEVSSAAYWFQKLEYECGHDDSYGETTVPHEGYEWLQLLIVK